MRRLLKDGFGRVGLAFTLIGVVALCVSLTVLPAANAPTASTFLVVGLVGLVMGLVRLRR